MQGVEMKSRYCSTTLNGPKAEEPQRIISHVVKSLVFAILKYSYEQVQS